MVCHQGPWQVQRWWKLLGPRWLEPEKDGGIRYEKSPRRGERHFRLSKSQRPRVDSKFFYLRDYEKAWHNYKEFREGTEGWFVDLLSLSFWGAFRRRCFTDDCTNFMVKRSVWEEKETDRQRSAHGCGWIGEEICVEQELKRPTAESREWLGLYTSL